VTLALAFKSLLINIQIAARVMPKKDENICDIALHYLCGGNCSSYGDSHFYNELYRKTAFEESTGSNELSDTDK
jgi:hypothetical protein